MKVKLLITAMIASETVPQGTVKDFGNEINSYLLKQGFARVFHPEDDPNTMDFEDIPSRLKDEVDNGELKGQIVDPTKPEEMDKLPGRKKKNK